MPPVGAKKKENMRRSDASNGLGSSGRSLEIHLVLQFPHQTPAARSVSLFEAVHQRGHLIANSEPTHMPSSPAARQKIPPSNKVKSSMIGTRGLSSSHAPTRTANIPYPTRSAHTPFSRRYSRYITDTDDEMMQRCCIFTFSRWPSQVNSPATLIIAPYSLRHRV